MSLDRSRILFVSCWWGRRLRNFTNQFQSLFIRQKGECCLTYSLQHLWIHSLKQRVEPPTSVLLVQTINDPIIFLDFSQRWFILICFLQRRIHLDFIFTKSNEHLGKLQRICNNCCDCFSKCSKKNASMAEDIAVAYVSATMCKLTTIMSILFHTEYANMYLFIQKVLYRWIWY